MVILLLLDHPMAAVLELTSAHILLKSFRVSGLCQQRINDFLSASSCLGLFQG